MKAIKDQIWLAADEFLRALAARDGASLAKFKLHKERADEVYEELRFVADLAQIRLGERQRVDKEFCGRLLIEVFEFDAASPDAGAFGVECALFLDDDFLGTLNGLWHEDKAQFEFRRFDL